MPSWTDSTEGAEEGEADGFSTSSLTTLDDLPDLNEPVESTPSWTQPSGETFELQAPESVLPESLNATSASEVIAPEGNVKLPPDVGSPSDVLAPGTLTPPNIGAAPSDSATDVLMPKELQAPAIPEIGSGTPDPVGAVAPPAGWQPEGAADVDAYTTGSGTTDTTTNDTATTLDGNANQIEGNQDTAMGGDVKDFDPDKNKKRAQRAIRDGVSKWQTKPDLDRIFEIVDALDDNLTEVEQNILWDNLELKFSEVQSPESASFETRDFRFGITGAGNGNDLYQLIDVLDADLEMFTFGSDETRANISAYWQQKDAEAAKSLAIFQQSLSIAVGFTPAGIVQDAHDAFRGQDVWGNKLAWWERGLVLVPFAGEIRGAARIAGAATRSVDDRDGPHL